LKSVPETGEMNFFIKALCLTFIFELILLMGLLGASFYSAPKTLKTIKAIESTLTLRYSRPFNAYYILMCTTNYDYCHGGLLGGNSEVFLGGLKNVIDIHSEDDALVIVMREGQDMRPQLQAEDVGYKFDETVIVDGVRRELYSSIYSLEGPDGQNTVKCHRIIVKYVL